MVAGADEPLAIDRVAAVLACKERFLHRAVSDHARDQANLTSSHPLMIGVVSTFSEAPVRLSRPTHTRPAPPHTDPERPQRPARRVAAPEADLGGRDPGHRMNGRPDGSLASGVHHRLGCEGDASTWHGARQAERTRPSPTRAAAWAAGIFGSTTDGTGGAGRGGSRARHPSRVSAGRAAATGAPVARGSRKLPSGGNRPLRNRGGRRPCRAHAHARSGMGRDGLGGELRHNLCALHDESSSRRARGRTGGTPTPRARPRIGIRARVTHRQSRASGAVTTRRLQRLLEIATDSAPVGEIMPGCDSAHYGITSLSQEPRAAHPGFSPLCPLRSPCWRRRSSLRLPPAVRLPPRERWFRVDVETRRPCSTVRSSLRVSIPTRRS